MAYEYEPATGYLSAVVSTEGRIEYTRDARGRLVRLRTSTGIDTEYRYDALGRIEKLIDRGLAGSASAAGEIAFKYDALGRKKEVVRPNGTKSVYGYDPLAGWTASIAHLAANGDNQLRLDYERDFTGIIDGIVEKHGAALDEQEWAYAYDGLKRLETAERTWTGTGGAAAGIRYGYEYDRNGNRRSETVETYDNVAAQWNVSTSDVYAYNALDQLTTKTAGAGAGAVTAYAWTALGQLDSETTGLVVKSFDWSADDRMLSVAQATDEDPDWSVAYAYDHRGERVGRKEADGSGASVDSRRFLSDDANPTGYTQALAEVSADGLATKANYWYADGFGPVAQVHDPSSPQFDARFLLGDHLSTTRGLTDSDGVANLYGYEPFGEIADGDGSLTSYAFTGQWRDPRSGLQNHRARWYDSTRGMWGSADPMWDFAGNFGNPSGYVGGNSPNALDPRGEESLINIATTAAIVSQLAAIALPIWIGYSGLSLLQSELSSGGIRSLLPTALMAGIEGGFSRQWWRGKVPPAGIGASAGFETLLIFPAGKQAAQSYMFAGGNIQPQWKEVMDWYFIFKFGLVWNVFAPSDYTGWYASATFGSLLVIHSMIILAFMMLLKNKVDMSFGFDATEFALAWTMMATLLSMAAVLISRYDFSFTFFYSPGWATTPGSRSFGFSFNVAPGELSVGKNYSSSLTHYWPANDYVQFWTAFVEQNIYPLLDFNPNTQILPLEQTLYNSLAIMNEVFGEY